MKGFFPCYLIALVGMFVPVAADVWAQEANENPPAKETVVAPAGAVPAVNPPQVHQLDRGDNAWMLTSSALVLFMTTPGLAMFYGGLVRKKNVVSVLMQCVFMMGLMTVLWATVGYSLAFGGSEAWIGNMDYLCMKGVQATWVESSQGGPGGSQIPLHPTYNVPMLTHMLFQGMFFIITPALICGAFAERMKFSTMVVFMILWGLLVYCPLCHWVWGGGILAYGTPHGDRFCAGGALDFAGGTVVHISSGVSALICALMLGRRIGYSTEPMPPHNLTYTALGAGMLWVGWFGFNAGSALAADGVAASAFAATHFSAAAGAVGLAFGRMAAPGQTDALRRFVGSRGRIGLHHAGRRICHPHARPRHGSHRWRDLLPGLLVAETEVRLRRFARRVRRARPGGIARRDPDRRLRIPRRLRHWPRQNAGPARRRPVLKAQLIATGVTWVFAIVMTAVLLKVLEATLGLRVSQSEEMEGLDLTQHGEEGYIFN